MHCHSTEHVLSLLNVFAGAFKTSSFIFADLTLKVDERTGILATTETHAIEFQNNVLTVAFEVSLARPAGASFFFCFSFFSPSRSVVATPLGRATSAGHELAPLEESACARRARPVLELHVAATAAPAVPAAEPEPA